MGCYIEVEMPKLLEALEELAAVEPAIRIPADELAALVERFGSNVRLMGSWNICGDGSLEIPKEILRAAARELGSASLDRAIEELRSGSDSPASQLLIAKVSEAYERYFLDLGARMQAETDPAQNTKLRAGLVKELFGG